MPYRIVRPLLFRFDAERAHHFGLGAARVLARRRMLSRWYRSVVSRPRDEPVKVAGLTFPNRIGLAAGLDKNAEAPLAWWAFGFGFMELGTVTPLPQAGKPKPRLFRFPAERALVNRMGFNNEGAAAVAERLAEQARRGLRPPCPVGVSVGKNAATPPEGAAEDYARAAAAVAAHADYLAINVSSPNTAGLRDLQSREEVGRIVEAIRPHALGRPLFVKVAPELTGEALAGVVEACVAEGVAGMIATNTLATHGRDGRPEGGLSGRPLRETALARVAEVRRLAGDRLVLIGCGGVDDAASARAMLDAGADLVQLYTGLIYHGPLLPARLTRAICDGTDRTSVTPSRSGKGSGSPR